MSTWSQAAVIGPTRRPIVPVSMRGSQCSAKIWSTPSSKPVDITDTAPPGTVSSAGWKINRTRPGSVRVASSDATPSRIAVCASCPHPWQQPSTVERYGTCF